MQKKLIDFEKHEETFKKMLAIVGFSFLTFLCLYITIFLAAFYYIYLLL